MAALDDYDFEGAGDAVEKLLRPYYEELLGVAYDDADELLPVNVSFDVGSSHIEEAIDGLAKRIRGVADTTRDDVRRWVDLGTSEGLSMAQIAEQIRGQADIQSKSRALAIARTETAQAYSAGSVLAYKEGGLTKKQWLATADSCDLCAEMDGEVAEMDKDFSGGVAHPPLHTNCTCAVSPVVD